MTSERKPLEGLFTPLVCRCVAAVLILGTALLRWWYLTSPTCTLDLAPDEGHYWHWSRHLDWSYYSKGPLVAWLIRCGTELLGPWSLATTGTLMPAIRFPAVLAGALMLLGLYVLTYQVFRQDRLALAVVIGFLAMPVVAVGSALMTIDAPYTCLWTWALVVTHQAVFGRASWAWPLAGLLVALGILAKYTMVLFVPSLALFLWFTPGLRGLLFRPGFWSLVACAALGGVPILLWNAQHEWVTFQHVFGQAGVSGEKKWYPLGPLLYVGGQIALMMLGWFVLWVGAVVANRPGQQSDPHRLYLWWFSVPMFVVFLLFSPRNGGGEINWPVTAYLSGMVLVAGWISVGWANVGPFRRGLTVATVGICLVSGLAATLVLHRFEALYPWLTRVAGPVTPREPVPLRRVDPTCRLRGWKELGREVDRVCQELREQGHDPVIVGTYWNLPGIIGAYTPGQPETYSVGILCGDRHSQYDFWSGPVTEPERFHGRTFLCVGFPSPDLMAGFSRVEPARIFTHHERGYPVANWSLTVLHDFRGFPRLPSGQRH